MERFVYFFAKRQEILCPSYPCTKVGIVGIKLEPDVMGQAVYHGIHHIVYLDKQAAVNTDTANHPPTEGLIDLPIGHDIQLFHTCCSESVLLCITSSSTLVLRRSNVETVT